MDSDGRRALRGHAEHHSVSRGVAATGAAFRRLVLSAAAGELGFAAVRFLLPTIAITQLAQSQAAVATLVAAMWLVPAVALPWIGLVADRSSRQSLIVASLGSAALASLVTASVASSMPMLIVLAAAVGLATTVRDIAMYSLLPALVGPIGLGRGNAVLLSTVAATVIAAPPLAGLVLDAAGSSAALVSAAALFAAAAVLARSLTAVERREAAAPRPGLAGGIRFVRTSRTTRALLGANATTSVAYGIIDASFLLYAYRELDVSVGLAGLLVALRGVGGVAGSRVSHRISGERPGNVSALSIGAWGAAAIALALAGTIPRPLLLLVPASILLGAAIGVYNVQQMTLRQQVVPDEVLGRVNAVMKLGLIAPIPVGAAFAGSFTGVLSPATMLLGAGAILLAAGAALAHALRARDAFRTPTTP